MRSIVVYILAIIATVCANAKTVQNGVVKEYNEKAQKTPLPGVELNVRSAGSTVSDKKGNFALNFLTLKPGEKINVRRIEKLGYEIFNKEAIEQWNLNPKNPFIIVMCKSDKFKRIRDNYERVSSASYAKQMKKEEAALAKLKKDGKLKEAEYQKQLLELRENYENQLDNLDNYIDRFSRIDLSELSAIEQEIIDLVQQGRIEEAIAKYEEQNYVDKYSREVSQIKEVSAAIERLENIKSSKMTVKDSILASIDRQIKTLQLAGGKENFDKIGVILRDVALADVSDIPNLVKYSEFCLKQNNLTEAKTLLSSCDLTDAPADAKFKVMMLLGTLYYKQEGLNESFEYYKKASDLANLIGKDKMQAAAYHNMGTAMLDSGKYDDALNYLQKAKEIRERYIEDSLLDLFDLSTTYGNIARSFEKKGELNSSVFFYEKAIQLQCQVMETDFVMCGDVLANTYNSLAALYHSIKNYDNAKKYYSNALSILEKAYTHNPMSSAINYANTLGNYAALLTETKLFDESLIYFNKTLKIYNTLSEIAPQLMIKPRARTNVNMANAYINIGNYEDANKLLTESLNLFNELRSEDSSLYVNEIVAISNNCAILLIYMNKIEDAEKMYKNAFSVCEFSKEGDLATEIMKGRTYFNMGDFYSKVMHDQDAAQQYFKLSIQLFEILSKANPQLISFLSMALNGIAYSFMFQENYHNAMKHINDAILYSPNDSNLTNTKIEIQTAMGDLHGAKETLENFKIKHPDFDVRQLPSYKLVYGE